MDGFQVAGTCSWSDTSLVVDGTALRLVAAYGVPGEFFARVNSRLTRAEPSRCAYAHTPLIGDPNLTRRVGNESNAGTALRLVAAYGVPGEFFVRADSRLTRAEPLRCAYAHTPLIGDPDPTRRVGDELGHREVAGGMIGTLNPDGIFSRRQIGAGFQEKDLTAINWLCCI